MKPPRVPHADDESSSGDGSDPALSPREREIMRAIALGHSSKQIAADLIISRKTVESHRTNLFRKFGFRCVADLVRYAIRIGLIEP
jgi:DNA-binding CsgD family transcriptional regulator